MVGVVCKYLRNVPAVLKDIKAALFRAAETPDTSSATRLRYPLVPLGVRSDSQR